MLPGCVVDAEFEADAPWFALAVGHIDLTVTLEADRLIVRSFAGVLIDSVSSESDVWESHLLAGLVRIAHGLGMLKLSSV